MFGKDIASLPRRTLPDIRRQIGVVFQDFRLLPHLSAFDNVALPLRAAGLAEKDIRKNVEELLVWLSQVPGASAGTVDHQTGGGSDQCAVFPCGVYLA
jgi:cell division transport system ATP-binding protein